MLVMADGPSRRVGAAGVWIGRQGDCDLVTPDPAASRRHALVRLTSEGVELVALGRETTLNGVAIERTTHLADGDQIGVPGLVLTVQIEASAPSAGPGRAGLVLARERGGSFGISHTPFVVGGAATADLILKDWPSEPVLRVHLVQGEAFVELCCGDAQHGDAALELGALEPLEIGDRITCRGEVFVVAAALDAVTTAVGARLELPSRIEIELLPRGGRVAFTLPSGERRVYLADRRLDLIMALLKPPAGHHPGEFIPDDVVRGVVWPRNPSVSRQEINTLIARCRRDLVDAGLAGPHLIERAPGGGGTRVVLAANAEIVVKR
jgi:FHA domain